jgi:hypothetical protein
LDANKQLKSEDWIASTHPEYRGAWSAATVEEYTASLTRDLELYKRCLATADKALDAVCNTIPCPPGYNAVQIMQLLGDLRESREKITQLETALASVRAVSQQETQWLDTDLWNHANALLNDIEGGGANLAEIKKSIYQSMRSAIIDYSKVRAASTGTGWIPVSEKLPPNNELVIVFDSMYDEVAEGQLSAYGWEKSIGKDDCEITAWQPLPAPPVASQKGKEEE